MPTTQQTGEPPEIRGVRRYFVPARGVRFHITEAGAADGRPVLLLHGWPQHHYTFRHLLADPPEGLRLIAPDLPGYGWSGPPPHHWAKEDVASDLLALLDELDLPQVLLVGHDWGGFVGYRMVLREPARFEGYLPLNIAHPWPDTRAFLAHIGRFLRYQPLVATFGVPLQRHTRFVDSLLELGVTDKSAFTAEDIRIYSDRFREPVPGRAATDTYRTFWLREIPTMAVRPERRRATVAVRALFGVDDAAIHWSLASGGTARADDYTVEYVRGCGHFIPEERPDLVRARLLSLAAETAAAH